jgi:hypothetical protein
MNTELTLLQKVVKHLLNLMVGKSAIENTFGRSPLGLRLPALGALIEQLSRLLNLLLPPFVDGLFQGCEYHVITIYSRSG